VVLGLLAAEAVEGVDVAPAAGEDGGAAGASVAEVVADELLEQRVAVDPGAQPVVGGVNVQRLVVTALPQV